MTPGLEVVNCRNRRQKQSQFSMPSPNIENIVVDEANHRRYIVLAPRVLSDGEIYRAIRQEILRRGGKPLAEGETLTVTVMPGRISGSLSV